MQLFLYRCRYFIAAFTQPVKSQRRIGTEVRAGIAILRDVIGHAPVGCLVSRGLIQHGLRQTLTVLPGKIIGHICFKVFIMRRHHAPGQDLLPANVGIIAQIAKSAFEVADHGRRQQQTHPADIRPDVLRE